MQCPPSYVTFMVGISNWPLATRIIECGQYCCWKFHWIGGDADMFARGNATAAQRWSVSGCIEALCDVAVGGCALLSLLSLQICAANCPIIDCASAARRLFGGFISGFGDNKVEFYGNVVLGTDRKRGRKPGNGREEVTLGGRWRIEYMVQQLEVFFLSRIIDGSFAYRFELND